jgi:CRP-like cAMP-binding protein
MPVADEIVDTLSQLTLFGDLAAPELEKVAHTFEEEWFAAGQRVLRQGFAGGGFYVVLDGEATVHVDGQEVGRLARGDFFGEISLLLGDVPGADVVATTPLRCVVLSGPLFEGFLREHPPVMYRMLQTEARRVRAPSRWRS